MDQNGGRQKRVTNGGKGVHKQGAGLGTGPVGRSDGYAGRGGSNRDGGGYGGGQGSGGGMMKIIIMVIVLLLGGGGGGVALLSGGSDGGQESGYIQESTDVQSTSQGASDTVTPATQNGQSTAQTTSLFEALSGFTGSNNVSNGWQDGTSNTGKLDRTVAPEAREKRTKIKGNGNDIVTIMVYMCGTDLESKHGMASNDIAEMCKASLSDNINIIIYTGGCRQWKTQGISNSTNQIYQVKNGGLQRLVEDDGAKQMIDPKTLTDFIKFCDTNFPADRKNLIFWDHGGGSISGYGYDEKYQGAGSMDLAGIDRALKNAGVTFDFIGFDACLMATLETALMLDPYADYLFASEETEPGIGWYYTNWLTELSANPSMETLEIGKNICDDFVSTCGLRCQGQKTTLSVIDLAEISRTVPEKLNGFAQDTGDMIRGDEFQTVSHARAQTREFATSSKIDQIDLVNFANNIGSQEASALSDALLSAVKYNRTSGNMTNAYGVSIYFPYQRTGKVKQAVNTYQQIGLGEDYSKCIQSFAGMETSGQLAAGGNGSALGSLVGGSFAGGTPSVGSDAISQLLGAFLMSGRSMPGVDADNADYMQDASVFDSQKAAEYIAMNQFDSSLLVWKTDDQGRHVLELPDEQWEKIESLQMNLFVDDGEGYVDLGLDNLYTFDEGRLVGDMDNTWISIDEQPVAFYYESTIKDGDNETITGRVPALLNGERVELILVFDKENPYGVIAGARAVYTEGETEAVAKSVEALEQGDQVTFLCDYYSYSGEYQDSYQLGDVWEYHEDAMISNTDVGSGGLVTYLLTDFYHREYWTPSLQTGK